MPYISIFVCAHLPTSGWQEEEKRNQRSNNVYFFLMNDDVLCSVEFNSQWFIYLFFFFSQWFKHLRFIGWCKHKVQDPCSYESPTFVLKCVRFTCRHLSCLQKVNGGFGKSVTWSSQDKSWLSCRLNQPWNYPCSQG